MLMEATSTIRPQANTPFEAYIIEKVEKIDEILSKLDDHDKRFTGIETKLEQHDARFAGIDAKFAGIDVKFTGIEAKLDQVIEKQEEHDVKFEGIFHAFDVHEDQLIKINNNLGRLNRAVFGGSPRSFFERVFGSWRML